MKKKIIAIVLAIAIVASLCVAFAACNKKTDDFKIGLITLHDENSTYDKNFIDAMKEAQEHLGLSNDQVIIATGIPEGDECYQKACELAEAGCKVIIADSFGHEQYMIKAAKQYPNVQFCHATGVNAASENLPNYANAFASIYEGRYLAGVAAGLKLQALGKTTAPKMGYVGAYTYAEVISGYTSFFLGVRSIVPTATMAVQFTGTWYDETDEKQAANALIAAGCDLISQHADSMGAPSACEAAGIPNVSYNGSTAAACPNTFIVSSRINWAPYYEYVVNQVKAGKAVDKDWVGTIATDSVQLTALGTAAADGTQAKLDEVKAKLANGTLQVFDTSKFTVGGQPCTSLKVNGVESVKTVNGITFVAESSLRSAPYFDLGIDGIVRLNEKY